MNAITKGYQDVPMTRRRAQLLAEYAERLATMLENAPDDQDLAEWVQSKIDRAAGAIQSAYHYLDQEDDEDLEKAVGHKYTHRKRVGTDKKGRARYRYYYAEHQGGGITRASFEAGSAFKLTYRGRRGHFHIDRVEGDQVFITHDSRPDMEPVSISKSELRALLKRQHTKAEQAHVEKRRKEVERIKSRNVKRGLGLALHRLRQAATQAGVELDERYQRKPKKKPAQVTDTPREDRFDTMPERERARQKTKIAFDHPLLQIEKLDERTYRAELKQWFAGREYERVLNIADKHNRSILSGGIYFNSKEDALRFASEVTREETPQETLERLEDFQKRALQSRKIARSKTLTESEKKSRIRDLGFRDSRPVRKSETDSNAQDIRRLKKEIESQPTQSPKTDTPREDRFDAMPEVEAPAREQLTETAREVTQGADNFETMPDVKQVRAREAIKRARGAQTRIKASNRADKLTATGRRARASINADKLLIEAIERIMDQDYREMERPLPSDINQRTPQQDNFAKLRGALNGLKSSQTLTRRSWTDDHESLQKKRIKSRSEIEDALKDLETRSLEEFQTQIQVSIEDLPPKGQRTAEDAKRFFGEPSKNEAIKRVTYERDGHIVTGPASGRGKGKFRYDLSLPRERFKDEPLLANSSSSNEIGTYDTLDEALTAAINQYEPSGQIIDRMIESAKEERERTARRMGVTPREQLTETAREVTQGADNFETMPEVEAPARDQLTETVRELTAPSSSPLNIDQANAQDTLTENRTRNPESKAADKALIESARELAKTSERGEEIKSALVDLMNAQQLKRYKRATGDMSARAEDMIEKRREARERLRSATSGEVINNFETMPETEAQPKKRSGPDISRYKRALSLAKKGKRLDKLTNGRRSKASREADQALISLAQEILEKDLGDVEVRTIYRKPSTMWTREESLKVAIGAMAGELKTRQRALGMRGGAEQAQELRADAREKLIDAIQEHVDRFLPDEVIDARLDRDLARDARETAKQEAREAQEARQYQQQTFTPEIQTAISYPVHGERRNRTRKSFESHFKTRKDGAIFRISKGEHIGNLAYAIIQNLPEEIREYKIGMDDLRSLIAGEIREAIEQRETPAELKDRIGSVITKRAQDNAVRRKEEITGTGEGAALREMKRNIKTLSGDGHFDHQGRGGPRSYVGLGAIEKTLSMSERLSDLYVDAIFRQALPPELERFKMPITRFSTKAADEVAGAFANKYETVGEIRDNISTIREQMRATIKSAVNKTADALVKRPNTLDMIKHSHEMITEQRDTQRQKATEAARALAQYTDDPQAHLAEIQELERQSDQAIAEQMEINREFASAYIHEASDLVERALETTKGEVIDNVMSVKTPKHADKFTAEVQGKANRKLMARIFNEVFEQVRREIEDEPIERGEKHPRNIADTVKKPSKTPAQFRGDIERADEEKRARKLAEREARRARRNATTAQPTSSTSGRYAPNALDRYKELHNTSPGVKADYIRKLSDEGLKEMRDLIDAESARVRALTQEERTAAENASLAMDQAGERMSRAEDDYKAAPLNKKRELERVYARARSEYADKHLELRRLRRIAADKYNANINHLVGQLSRPLEQEERKRARRTQKSALHLTNYRADLYRTIERLAS